MPHYGLILRAKNIACNEYFVSIAEPSVFGRFLDVVDDDPFNRALIDSTTSPYRLAAYTSNLEASVC
jgi:hypothetical protein